MNSIGQLLDLSLKPVRLTMRRWWLGRLEQHYLMSADVEAGIARQAQANAAHYHKLAVLARMNQR